MSSKKNVLASFATPRIEKNRIRGKGFSFLGPMNIFFNIFKEKRKWLVGLFKYSKRHNISLTLPKQKETRKSKI